MQVAVKRLSPEATLPTRGSAAAAGWDLYAVEDVVVSARGRKLLPTGVAFAIPNGYYGRVAPRSGLALKHGIDVGAGVIDSDYCGEVSVLLFNLSDDDFPVQRGSRIAQVIFTPCPAMTLVESDVLPSTSRASGGFGSTGQ